VSCGIHFSLGLCKLLILLRGLWCLSEWVNDCCLTPSEQLFCYIMTMMMKMFTLYLTNTISWIFIVLAHWNNIPQVRHVVRIHYDTSSQTHLKKKVQHIEWHKTQVETSPYGNKSFQYIICTLTQKRTIIKLSYSLTETTFRR
jgi:hypothetical protein